MSRLSDAALLSEVSKLKELNVDLTEKYNQVVAENADLKARLRDLSIASTRTVKTVTNLRPTMVCPNPICRAMQPQATSHQRVNRGIRLSTYHT
ncbi:MAG: hypothetical protein OXC02_00720 [Rhodobacteraceae bacterium]|nr:hypothetical protein [Paracoccaceae bacterium]